MSIHHLVERLSVRREVPPISFIDDDLSVITYRNLQHAKQSQIGLFSQLNTIEKKLLRSKALYYRKRDFRNQQIKEYRAKNPDKASKWHRDWRVRNPDYLKTWQKNNREKCTEYARKYRAKRDAKMTPEQLKTFRHEQYQKNRANQIAKYGIEGWRKICNERSRLSRQKKRMEQKNE
jgi:hypothetical protein